MFSHPDRMGGSLSLKLDSSYQNPGSLRNLTILPVPNRAHFCSPLASTFPGICASHWVCLVLLHPRPRPPPDNYCSRLPCSFQLLPQWLILIYLFQLFDLDVSIIGYCDIYYCDVLGVLVHHHYGLLAIACLSVRM